LIYREMGLSDMNVASTLESVPAVFNSGTETQPSAPSGQGAPKSGVPGDTLTPDQKAEVEELKKIDAKVKAHEQAHKMAGGQYVRGSAHYNYKTGPDGKRYAVGGDVSIDASPEKDPKKTIAKMETVIRAALAPADPSPQDRSVASKASQEESNARRELSQSETAGGNSTGSGKAPTGTGTGYGVTGRSSGSQAQSTQPGINLFA
jgi:hypothetical protein